LLLEVRTGHGLADRRHHACGDTVRFRIVLLLGEFDHFNHRERTIARSLRLFYLMSVSRLVGSDNWRCRNQECNDNER